MLTFGIPGRCNNTKRNERSQLFNRLDAIVDANLSLEIVFDNVPWSFVRNATKLKHAGTYGNPWAPDDDLKEL